MGVAAPMVSAVLAQVLPSYMNAFWAMSAKQKADDAHDKGVNPSSPSGMPLDQVRCEYVKASPPPTAAQNDSDVHETDVSRFPARGVPVDQLALEVGTGATGGLASG